MIKFEHFGINTPDAQAMAKWYVTHLGMTVAKGMDQPPYAHFLADAGGRVVAEIYTNPNDPVPDYANQHQLRFHFAFAVDDPEAMKRKVIEQGATLIEEAHPEPGSVVITLRDPWGIPFQLCRRAEPFS